VQPSFAKSGWVGEVPTGGTAGKLPERVFWDDAQQSRSIWLRNAKAKRKEMVALWIVSILYIF
jgi:hypothetical protein